MNDLTHEELMRRLREAQDVLNQAKQEIGLAYVSLIQASNSFEKSSNEWSAWGAAWRKKQDEEATTHQES